MNPERPQVVEKCPACETPADVTAHEPFTRVTCPTCSREFRARVTFDHFVIQEQIGTGGMSRVFRARDTSLDRDVALKILNKACSEDSKRARQFEKEAEITARMSHPNVVRVFTAGRDQGHFYIAMELVAGGSLEAFIRDQGKMKETRVLEMAIQAVQGLKAAKEAGLIHRDIKPGNILFAEDGTPKIVDFGLAIFARDSDGSGEIWATPYYVPLETLRHEPEDFRSDIYSLGATLYHALLGKPPCAKDTASLEELKALKSKPIHLKASIHKISEETCALLERTLAIRPAERYRSYDEFLEHLKYAQRRLRRGGKGRPWPGRSAAATKRKLWAAAAALAVAGTVTGLVLTKKKPGPPPASGGGSLITDADPTAGSDSSTSARFLAARDAMLSSDFAKARQLFDELGNNAATRQPTRNWARFNAGLCALLMADAAGARDSYAALAAEPLYSAGADAADLAHFFADTSKWLAADALVPADRMADCPGDSVRAIGLLAAGLKNWHAGDAGAAAGFLKAFAAASPPRSAEWVAGCKRLAADYLADAGILETLTPPDTARLTPEQLDAAATAARNSLEKLRIPGACREKAAAAVEALAATTAKRKVEVATTAGGNHNDQVNAELNLVQSTAAAVTSLGEAYRFSEAAAKLKSLTVNTPEAIPVREAHAAACMKAAAFLEQLSRDLAKPVEGVATDASGNAVRALWTFSSGVFTARPAQGPEIKVPAAKMLPARLVELAEDILKRVSDTDEYYRRSELIYCFALRTGLTGTAEAFGDTLAGEFRPFRDQLSLLRTVEFVTASAPK